MKTMTKVIHIKDAPTGWQSNPQFVYIGRPMKSFPVSFFGNPIIKGRICQKCGKLHSDNGSTLDCYRKDLLHGMSIDPKFRDAIKALHGKTLVCFCKPGPCHGDVLAEVAATLNNITKEVKQMKEITGNIWDVEADALCITTNGEIKGFRGEYSFLSNFYESEITHPLVGTFRNVEAAYQASKCKYASDIPRFFNLSGAEAKKLGRQVDMLDNWNDTRVSVMLFWLKKKFAPDTELAQKLINTGDAYIEETNYWNDTFWGVCKGVGENWLGKLLMQVRKELGENQ